MGFEGIRRYKLKDVCVKIGSGATPTGGKESYSNEGEISLIRSQNVLDFTFSTNGLAFLNEEQARKLNNVQVLEGDVLLNITGDSVARVCQAPGFVLPARVNQHVAIIRADDRQLSNGYLKYYLLNPGYKEFMLGLASVGATRNALTKGMIEDFNIDLPDFPTQQRIASILSAFDDKIALNRQMNQTLEEMARAVFREWFVNFNYPGADDVLEADLPAGWRISMLGEVIDIKHGYAFKGEFFSDEETDQLLVTPGNFNIGGGFNQVKTKFYSAVAPSDYILHREDLIVTMTDLSKAGDTLGYSALVPTITGKQILHNQRIGKIINKTDLPLKHYLYWLMRQNDYRNFVLGGATGSTVKHTSPTNICGYNFIIPTNNVLIAFQEFAKGIFDKIDNNDTQSRTLATLRDSLLPKLMKGEIVL